MRSRLSTLTTDLLAMILIASVSLCCCNIQHITAGLSDENAGSAVTSAPSCCSSRCGPSDPADDPGDQSAPPPKGCKSCCIKGSGLKNPSPPLPEAFELIVVSPTPRPAIQLASLVSGSSVLCLALSDHHHKPATLLGLRCALRL